MKAGNAVALSVPSALRILVIPAHPVLLRMIAVLRMRPHPANFGVVKDFVLRNIKGIKRNKKVYIEGCTPFCMVRLAAHVSNEWLSASLLK